MKANKLMIGDWVFLKNGKVLQPCKVTVIGNATQNRNKIGISVCLDTSDEFPTCVFKIDEISPIPLTAEILEKNGFVYHKEIDIFQLYIKHIYVVEVGIYHPDFINIGYREHTPDGVQEDIISSICKIDGGNIYVHELQHALRLCGIEKEIVL